MRLFRRLAATLRSFFHRGPLERELDTELRSYLESSIAEKTRAGMTPQHARREALLELGGMDQVKERVREERWGTLLETIAKDVRHALRVSLKRPVFTAVIVLTLALGIGANTAIFSIVNAVLLRPLPYDQPERLVYLRQSYPQRNLITWNLSQANFAAYRDLNKTLQSFGGFTWAGYNLTGAGEAARLQAASVTGDFFGVFGVPPLHGRTFLPEEDAPGRNHVCILSYRFWQQRFGGDPRVVGTMLLLNNSPMEVVGVMPAGFAFPSPAVELWVPFGLNPQRTSPFLLRGVARLKPGVQASQVEAETTAILRNLGRNDAAFVGSNAVPPEGADLKTVVTPLGRAVAGESRTPLLVLLGAVGLVLLIACANVANLLLGRAAGRGREIAVRYALGASPGRVIRQFLTESLLLGSVGGVAGILLAWWGVGLVSGLPLPGILRIEEVSIDGTVLLFAGTVVLVVSFLFGLAPALRARRLGAEAGLREGMRGTPTTSTRRANAALVAAQFALSMMLLVGTGLLLRSFQRLLVVDPGFRPENLLTMRLLVSPQKYSQPAQPAEFFRRVLESVRTLPGVRAAGVMAHLPFTGDLDSDGTVVEGHEPPAGGIVPVTQLNVVSPGLFRTLGMPLLRGRDFLDSDREGSPGVAVVDQTLALRYWPDGNAVGRRIRFSWDESPERWMTIVGVVGGIRDNTLAHAEEPHLYLPSAQEYVRLRPSLGMTLMVRTAGDPAAATSAVRARIRELDPDVPAYAVSTMAETIGQTLARPRLTNSLLVVFAATALLLAAIGIYGVMSLDVSSRVQEFGVRMALGARPSHVLQQVLGQGLKVAGAGLLLGLVGAFAAARFLQSLLFQVSATDPVTLVGVPVILIGVALLACYLPARRATRIDPLAALRHE